MFRAAVREQLREEDLDRELKLECQRARIHAEYTMMQKMKQREGRQLTYPNQKEAAQKVIQAFQSGKYLTILVAQPGAGKTGVMLEVCTQLATHADDNLCVLTEDTYILSGMSDVQWRNDMQRSMIPAFKENIRHRGEISKIEEKIAVLKNGLIVNDECHIAAGKDMKMSKMFQSTGVIHVEYAIQNSIRVLEVSATPDAILWDSTAWGTKKEIIKLEPSPSYKGFRVMLNERRIRKAPVFTTKESVQQFIASWQTRYTECPTKKYFPIRLLTKSTELMGWMKNAASRMGWNWFDYNSDERIVDIDVRMKNAPDAHTIIFIKGFWRASKRIERTHVGGSFEEPPRGQNVTSAAQGLIARFCNTYDYDAEELAHPEWRPVHYGDLDAIELYLKWFEGGCDYKNSDYSSTTLKSKGGRVTSKPTMVHHSMISGLDRQDIVIAEADNILKKWDHSPFQTSPNAAKQWAKEHLNEDKTKRIPITGECNSDYTENKEHRGTLMHVRGNFVAIPSEDSIRAKRDLAKCGGGVRVTPVKMGEAAPNQYVVTYMYNWMKLESLRTFHPEQAAVFQAQQQAQQQAP